MVTELISWQEEEMGTCSGNQQGEDLPGEKRRGNRQTLPPQQERELQTQVKRCAMGKDQLVAVLRRVSEKEGIA